MVAIFSADEARLKAVKAKKIIDELKIKKEVSRQTLVKERAILKAGLDRQQYQIIFAAIDQKTELLVGAVYFYQDLIKAGVKVLEVGEVKNQFVSQHNIEEFDNEKEILKKQVFKEFDKFINDSKNDLKEYYGSMDRFHKLNFNAVCDALNSNEEARYSGDDIFFSEVPKFLMSKYYDNIDNINRKIREYRRCKYNSNSDVYSSSRTDDDLIEGEYYFGFDDESVDVLKPTHEGNFFKIIWTSESGDTHMNKPLVSAEGLAWLSSYRGQSLIELIFESLSSAAEQGKSIYKLDFSLSKDGWYFLYSGRKIYCCIPVELVGIIEQQSFTIDSTASTDESFSIKVSW
jgi:hypothetical protein